MCGTSLLQTWPQVAHVRYLRIISRHPWGSSKRMLSASCIVGEPLPALFPMHPLVWVYLCHDQIRRASFICKSTLWPTRMRSGAFPSTETLRLCSVVLSVSLCSAISSVRRSPCTWLSPGTLVVELRFLGWEASWYIPHSLGLDELPSRHRWCRRNWTAEFWSRTSCYWTLIRVHVTLSSGCGGRRRTQQRHPPCPMCLGNSRGSFQSSAGIRPATWCVRMASLGSSTSQTGCWMLSTGCSISAKRHWPVPILRIQRREVRCASEHVRYLLQCWGLMMKSLYSPV